MDKNIKNADIIACKFGPVLIRATNHRFEIAGEKKWKSEEMVER